jgi:hypothetical protein
VRSAVAALLLAICCCCACGDQSQTEVSATPDPLETARELLALHDLKGARPGDRTAEVKDKQVDRAAVAALVADFEGRDPFVTDLYVGFVVGALAQFQDRLIATARTGRATVVAGRARIAMKLDSGKWRIVLEESVPDEIKQRAAAEKQRFDEAQARSR